MVVWRVKFHNMQVILWVHVGIGRFGGMCVVIIHACSVKIGRFKLLHWISEFPNIFINMTGRIYHRIRVLVKLDCSNSSTM